MRNTTSKLFISILYPSLFVLLLWAIWLFEYVSKTDLAWYGLFPRTVHGLIGIFTSPLLHSNAGHLFSNTIPLLILGSVMFYFYRPIAFQIFFWIYIITGIWVWVMARSAYHIGASGLVYGFTSFIFFSGVFRKDPKLLSISMFVVFLYGSTVYGMFPFEKGISWESHMMGALAGLITAYHFRKEGPAPKVYDLGNDEENELIDVSGDETEVTEEHTPTPANPFNLQPPVHYTFIPKEKETDKMAEE